MEPKAARCVLLFAAISYTEFPSLALKPTSEDGHVGIVRAALSTITHTLTTGETIRFSNRAIDQVRDATAGVDEIFSPRGEFSVPMAHCDDELLPECTQRLITIKGAVVIFARACEGEEARAQLGRALHTLQDFYSHSNWVNSPGPGNTSFNPVLGTGTIARLARSVATCVDDFFDRTLTGAGLTNTTTGYFGSVEPPAGKCAHGVLPGAGIHKDERGRPFFNEARGRALEGTRDFINQILTTLGSDDAAVRALMDARGTLGFVIDDTGSMGGVISSVKTVVSQIVAAVSTDPNPA
jgi:von Willebrand factor A domain-containing protein 7